MKRYGRTAKLFHWLTALAVFCALPMGILMLRIESGPIQNRLFDLHRSIGALILVLAATRLLWRFLVKPPAIEAVLPAWQRRTALVTHWTLYGLLLAAPLMGWAGTSAFGAAISVFGLFELPAIVAKNRELAEVLLDIHIAMVVALGGLLVLHIAAALHHHIVRKDDTLRRMLPGRGGKDVAVTDR